MDEQKPVKPELRGLYRHVNISVKALDWIIVACIAVIVLVLVVELQDPGFLITFDSRGGSDVAAVKVMYGDTVPAPVAPDRQGYRFTGWYRDHGCFELWDMENQTVETDMTLYAGWEKLE